MQVQQIQIAQAQRDGIGVAVRFRAARGSWPQASSKIDGQTPEPRGWRIAEADTCCDLSVDTEGDFWRAVSSGSIEKSPGNWQ